MKSLFPFFLTMLTFALLAVMISGCGSDERDVQSSCEQLQSDLNVLYQSIVKPNSAFSCTVNADCTYSDFTLLNNGCPGVAVSLTAKANYDTYLADSEAQGILQNIYASCSVAIPTCVAPVSAATCEQNLCVAH